MPSYTLFEEAFDAAPAGLMVADGAGRVLRANRRAIQLLGGDPAGQLAASLGSDLEIRRVPLAAGALYLVADVREPGALRRLASLGSVAAGLAHDVNNPLSVVVANASYVADELGELQATGGVDVREAISAQQELLRAADRIAKIMAEFRARSRPPSDPVPLAPASSRARVLVVDDEEPVLRALGRMLRDHDVVTVGGGRQALDLLAGGGGAFDVIFADIGMPEMSGIELFEQLKARQPADARRVVFVTGGAITDDTRDFLERVPNPRLEKPVRTAQLADMIERVTSSQPRPPG